jgi:hypothetical protein
MVAGWSGLAKRYSRHPRTPKRWGEQGLLPPPDAIRNGVPYWYEETLDTHDRQSVAEAMSRRSDPAALSQPRRVRQSTPPTLKRTTASGPAASGKEKMT